MRKGFTIIELLVASLLLGMLTTILTMVFNQSSIAWRTGIAGTSRMDTARLNITDVREQADTLIVDTTGNSYQHLTSLWDDNGNLRTRACDVTGDKPSFNKTFTPSKTKLDGSVSLGSVQGGSSKEKNYTVNVKSAGPDKQFNTWDDIWSWPDDFD